MGRRRRVPLVFLRVGTGFIKIRVVSRVGVNGTVHGTWGIRSIPRPRGRGVYRLGLLGPSTRFGRARGVGAGSGAGLVVDTCCSAARGRGHGGERQ